MIAVKNLRVRWRFSYQWFCWHC